MPRWWCCKNSHHLISFNWYFLFFLSLHSQLGLELFKRCSQNSYFHTHRYRSSHSIASNAFRLSAIARHFGRNEIHFSLEIFGKCNYRMLIHMKYDLKFPTIKNGAACRNCNWTKFVWTNLNQLPMCIFYWNFYKTLVTLQQMRDAC